MRVAGLVIALGLGGAQAAAGAWPREPGSGFVSVGYEVTTTRRELSGPDPAPDFAGYRTLFAEIGVTRRLTAGLDLGGDEVGLTGLVNDMVEDQARAQGATSDELRALDATDRGGQTWSGVAFLRAALGSLDARHRVAAQLGIGRRSYEDPGPFFGREEMREETILRPLVAYGYGFGGERFGGWLSAEASTEFRQDTAGRPWKLDATLGLRPAESRLSYLLQVQSGDFPEADPYVKLQPGVVLAMGRGVSLESGVIWGVRGEDSVGARVALWLEW